MQVTVADKGVYFYQFFWQKRTFNMNLAQFENCTTPNQLLYIWLKTWLSTWKIIVADAFLWLTIYFDTNVQYTIKQVIPHSDDLIKGSK